jgi:hypothetical protein
VVRFCRLTQVNSDGRQCIQGDHVAYISWASRGVGEKRTEHGDRMVDRRGLDNV